MKSIGLIVLDLDGTLLSNRKRLSPRNKETLVKCARTGIQIVPTTGRAVGDIIEGICMPPGANYAIITNGSTVVDLENARCLLRHTLTNEKTLEILGIADKYNAMYGPYISGRGITQPEFVDHMEDYGVSPTIREVVRATRDAVSSVIRCVKEYGSDAEKMNIYLGDLEERRTLREDLGSVEGIVISSSLYSNLEINTHGVAKGDALVWLANYLSIDRKATMAFSDEENDISMIEATEVGVAMGNGLEAVKTAADEITLTNDEDGVAATTEHLIINWN